MLNFLLSFFSLSFYRGVVRVDVNLQDVDIDQCSSSGWFAGTHRCNLTTMEVSVSLIMIIFCFILYGLLMVLRTKWCQPVFRQLRLKSMPSKQMCDNTLNTHHLMSTKKKTLSLFVLFIFQDGQKHLVAFYYINFAFLFPVISTDPPVLGDVSSPELCILKHSSVIMSLN